MSIVIMIHASLFWQTQVWQWLIYQGVARLERQPADDIYAIKVYNISYITANFQ